MDLICGRTVPGQWQALVIVALETLTGASEQPAEIPGLGLINATEARDLLAHAEIRRGVVDERGQLVSIDSQVHRPDLAEPVPLDRPHPDTGLSLEVEPEPLDTTPEDPPIEADLSWLHQVAEAGRQEMVLGAQDLDAHVIAAMSALEAELRALLEAHAPVGAASRSSSPVQEHRPWMRIDIDGWRHDPDAPGPGGPGPGGPDPGAPRPARPGASRDPDDRRAPEPELEPDPPSLDDVLWAEATTDRATQDALEPSPRCQQEPWTPYPRHSQPEPRWTSWTRLALTAALATVTRVKPDPQPLSSTAYALPPRMARFIKHRDITCSFPGCPRLAWNTENDHLLPWPQGRTTIENIDCKCKRHHQAKTHGGYQTTRLPGGGVRWTTPLGRTYDRHPRPLLRGF